MGNRLFFFLCSFFFWTFTNAASVYVNDQSTIGDVFCSSVGNNANLGTASQPVASLDFAINNFVLGLGDTIYVDAGTYSDQLMALTNADAGVVVIGSGRSTTIFDGQNYTNRWLVISGNNIKIQDMTVRRYGHSTGLFGQALTLQDASGMVVENILFEDQGTSGGEANLYIATTSTISTTATINNCIFQNTLGNFGGGIDVCANTISSVPSLNVNLNNCLVENCGKNSFNGGALLLYKGLSSGATTQAPVVVANECVFGSPSAGNVAQRGGGIYVDNGSILTLNGACVSNNQAIDVAGPDGGGGIYILDGTVNLIEGMVTNNSANIGTNKYGGGIFVNKLFSGTSTLNIEQTIISGNIGLDGGGMYLDRSTTTMKNVLMYDNVATDEGGAICTNDGSCFLTMHNCTVTENTTTSLFTSRHGGLQRKNIGTGSIINCIFWNNLRADILSSAGITVSFSIVDNGGTTSTYINGGNVLTSDPLFANAGIDDFRLSNITSPAIDFGTFDSGNAPLADLVGTIRVNLLDLGAYEFGASSLLVRDCPSIREQILPVILASFRIECENDQTIAQWETVSEVGESTFILEGSLDAREFAEVLTFKGDGAANKGAAYKVELPKIGSQYSFFRLKVKDQNGEIQTIAKVLSHSPCSSEAFLAEISPNPVSDALQFSVHSPISKLFHIRVVNSQGASIFMQNLECDVFYRDNISVNDWPSGIYFFQISDQSGKWKSIKFLKI